MQFQPSSALQHYNGIIIHKFKLIIVLEIPQGITGNSADQDNMLQNGASVQHLHFFTNTSAIF